MRPRKHAIARRGCVSTTSDLDTPWRCAHTANHPCATTLADVVQWQQRDVHCLTPLKVPSSLAKAVGAEPGKVKSTHWMGFNAERTVMHVMQAVNTEVHRPPFVARGASIDILHNRRRDLLCYCAHIPHPCHAPRGLAQGVPFSELLVVRMLFCVSTAHEPGVEGVVSKVTVKGQTECTGFA